MKRMVLAMTLMVGVTGNAYSQQYCFEINKIGGACFHEVERFNDFMKQTYIPNIRACHEMVKGMSNSTAAVALFQNCEAPLEELWRSFRKRVFNCWCANGCGKTLGAQCR